uniref:Si:ch73-119p20.1 n=1 Tax=Astyanax mexicanus TaxID=7994 RepID=A0A3B1J2B9_ASTMX
MDTKAKSGSKSASRAEKKDPAPLKPDPVPAEPSPPTEPEKTADDGAASQEGAPEGGEGKGSGCEMLEHLKPFLIGGAVVALGAILVGAILLAKKN